MKSKGTKCRAIKSLNPHFKGLLNCYRWISLTFVIGQRCLPFPGNFAEHARAKDDSQHAFVSLRMHCSNFFAMPKAKKHRPPVLLFREHPHGRTCPRFFAESPERSANTWREEIAALTFTYNIK